MTDVTISRFWRLRSMTRFPERILCIGLRAFSRKNSPLWSTVSAYGPVQRCAQARSDQQQPSDPPYQEDIRRRQRSIASVGNRGRRLGGRTPWLLQKPARRTRSWRDGGRRPRSDKGPAYCSEISTAA